MDCITKWFWPSLALFNIKSQSARLLVLKLYFLCHLCTPFTPLLYSFILNVYKPFNPLVYYFYANCVPLLLHICKQLPISISKNMRTLPVSKYFSFIDSVVDTGDTSSLNISASFRKIWNGPNGIFKMPFENNARKKPEGRKSRSDSLSVALEDVFNYAYFIEKLKLT